MISVGAIIFRKENSEMEYLTSACEKWYPFEISKGRIEEGENMAGAVLREIKEKTGISISKRYFKEGRQNA